MADIYSVNEAAQRLGLDPSQVRRLLIKGDIDGKKLGRDWVVLSLNYKKKKFGVGRKKKKEVVKWEDIGAQNADIFTTLRKVTL